MLNQFDGSESEASAEVRLRSIYDMLIADASSAREVIQNVLDRTEGRYLVIRDTEGRILIRVSFIGGVIILALALFVTRLRWVPFIPLILMVVYMRLSFQMDHGDEAGQAAQDAGNAVKSAADAAKGKAQNVKRDVKNAAQNIGDEVSNAARNVHDDVSNSGN